MVVLHDGDLQIAALLIDHASIHPALGNRVTYKGRSLVLSGDTRKSAAAQREAQGVDLLVHEALSEPLMAALETGAGQADRPKLKKIFNDTLNDHTTPEQAAEVARDAPAVALTHGEPNGALLYRKRVPVLPAAGDDAVPTRQPTTAAAMRGDERAGVEVGAIAALRLRLPATSSAYSCPGGDASAAAQPSSQDAPSSSGEPQMAPVSM